MSQRVTKIRTDRGRFAQYFVVVPTAQARTNKSNEKEREGKGEAVPIPVADQKDRGLWERDEATVERSV